jgi:hypothetical protein
MVGRECITSATPDTGSCCGVTRFSAFEQDRPALAFAKQDQTISAFGLAKQNRRSRAALAIAKPDLEHLGRWFDQIQAHDAMAHWCWTQDLFAIYEAGRASTGERLTETEIGRRLAPPDREPYSRSWVSHALKAARQWPQPPRTAQERSGFLCDFYGHARRTGAAPVTLDEQIRRVLRRFRNAATDALKLGLHPQDIRDSLDKVLCGAPTVQLDPARPAPPDLNGAQRR